MPWFQVPGRVLEDSPLPSPPGPGVGGPWACSPLPSGRHCGSALLSCFFRCLAFTWEPVGGAAAAGPALHSGAGGRAGWRAPVSGGGLPAPRGPLALQGSGVHISEKDVPPACPLHGHWATSNVPTAPRGTLLPPRLASADRVGQMLPEQLGTRCGGTGVPASQGIYGQNCSADCVPGLEVRLGDRAAGGAVRSSSRALLLVGGLGSGAGALGPAGGFLPFRGWLRSTSAGHGRGGARPQAQN